MKTLSIKLLAVISLGFLITFNGFSQEKVTMLNPNVFFGGNLQLQFGTQTVVNVSPMVGYKFTERLHAGVGGTYLYTSDSRYNYSRTIYGGNIFGRYILHPNFFGQAEIEALNLSDLIIYTDPATLTITVKEGKRYWADSYLIGLGYRMPMGERASANIMIMWNLNQNSKSPYENPIMRIGFDF